MKILKLIFINRVFGDVCEKECTTVGRNVRESKDKGSNSFDGSFSLPLSLCVLLLFFPFLGKIFLSQFTEVESSGISYFRNLT